MHIYDYQDVPDWLMETVRQYAPEGQVMP